MSFTYSQLKTDVSNRLHNKLGRVLSVRDGLNSGVRKCVTLPMKTLRRRYSSPIRLLDGVYDYYCPTDIQGAKVIDLRPVTDERVFDYQWWNVLPESFDRLRSGGADVLSVTSDGNLRLLRAGMKGNDSKVTLSTLDSITAGGAWAAVGTASNLATDTSTYLYGSGSVKFDLGAGTQDGISTTLTADMDVSDYVADGSLYVSASFPSTGGLTGVTVRVGSDASNYIEISATTDISGNSITSGFNMFKLDFSGGTVTGTPDYGSIDYIALLVDKDATTMTGVRFDNVVAGVGSQHYVEYYSRHGWRSASGTWKADSTLDTDILNAEEEEYQIIVESCVEELANAAREYQDADRAALRLRELKPEYLRANPDCSIPLTADGGTGDWDYCA
jgi:hypothetical protein